VEVVCPKCGSRLAPDEKGRAFCLMCGREYYVCLDCGEVFTTIQGLAGHRKKHRKDKRTLSGALEDYLPLILNDKRTLNEARKIIVRLSSLNADDKHTIILLAAVLAKLGEIADELKTITARLEKLEKTGAAPAARATLTAQTSELPSYAAENPWLAVISKRGR